MQPTPLSPPPTSAAVPPQPYIRHTPGSPIRVRFGGLRLKIIAMVLTSLLILLGVTTVMAAGALRAAMVEEFRSKGESIALSIANTTEGYITEGRDASTIQGFVDRFRHITGVGYLYVVDAEAYVVSHTFSPEFPENFEKAHPFPGEPDEKHFVDVKEIDVPERGRQIDLVVPIQQGRLGAVHVGMRLDVIEQQVSAAVARMGASALAVFLGAMIVALVLTTRLVKPIRELTELTHKIVEQGDLTQVVSTGATNDEVAVLAHSFGALVNKLRNILLSLRELGTQLTHVVGTLTTMTSQQSAMLSRQAASLQETGATVKEIQETSRLAAEKAGGVSEVTTRAEAMSQTGQRSLDDTLGGLDEIQQHVQRVVDRIAELSERTGQVAEITETVKDLSDQSKVLALNAAIEATKAGEHGKGFAVVAREIRALATQSIESTMRVREILNEVEASIRGVVDGSREGRERVRKSVDQVRVGGENIRQLATVVDENAAAAKQIVVAVAQQNAGINQIFTAVTDMNRMMNESVSALKQTHEVAQDLRLVSGAISDIFSAFKV